MEDAAGMKHRENFDLAAAAIRRWPLALERFGAALRAFLSGFVGPTAIARESDAAKRELGQHASGRGRCC